jgi:hypothetical protein
MILWATKGNAGIGGDTGELLKGVEMVRGISWRLQGTTPGNRHAPNIAVRSLKKDDPASIIVCENTGKAPFLPG